ncbi:imidazole glycerol phosphate synthase subunit HisH [Paenibacillus xylanexedens]|uniref:imidazole glycerol phosphate synthase subunit HisH n=1 Tax=Paenibacillus xylanexedens TaxID=528191 RepID=UPI000F52AF63|nr:imidazole glycerol phosphate synthase subunit HisH [Paenibacillus xylanexedens]RPK27815.1 hypothetical protein EDO6_03338 [Paenibacillus xylanexedens]
MISIIDYKAGNAPSVYNALKSLNIECKLVHHSAELEEASGIILPGVGSAGETMKSLRDMDFIPLLNELVINQKVPFLGICVGLQVLFDYSEEGNTNCLGWIPGKVSKFPASEVRVPQMGWNKVTFLRSSPLTYGVPNNSYLYFVNSYFALPTDSSYTLGSTNYHVEFCSVVSHENIHATQFHVEKSGEVGLKILENFCLLKG